jgi:hypothetical protein
MADKAEIKINFTGFWHGFDKTNNFFYNLLIKNYRVTIADKPDILFFAENGSEHINYNCTKVFYTGENVRPDFMLCDFAFSFDYPVTKRNYRLPLYALYDDVTKLLNKQINAAEVLAQKKGFCCFVVSNDKCKVRNDFFTELSKYKKVDSGGKLFNNIGGPVKDKPEFIRGYKFVISFENESYPGYTTEKAFEPLQQNSIPIYWGNPLVGNDFNTESFINCHDYASFNEVIQHIIAVDNDDALYLDYLNKPAFKNDRLNEYVKEEDIVNRLDEIVEFHFARKFNIRKTIRPAYFFYKNSVRPLIIRTKSRTLKGAVNRVLRVFK